MTTPCARDRVSGSGLVGHFREGLFMGSNMVWSAVGVGNSPSAPLCDRSVAGLEHTGNPTLPLQLRQLFEQLGIAANQARYVTLTSSRDPSCRSRTDCPGLKPSGRSGEWLPRCRRPAFSSCSEQPGEQSGNDCKFRHLIPGAAFKSPSGFLFLDATPLFKEERHIGLQALIANVGHPCGIDRACPRP
jgi:hypothetical protein